MSFACGWPRAEHAAQLAERRSEMLIRADWPSIPFECGQAAGCVTLTTARLRLEFRQFPWQFRAYPATSPPAPLLRGEGSDVPFFAERVADRAYGPRYEVLPVGFEIGIGGREAVREAVAVTPGEAIYALFIHSAHLSATVWAASRPSPTRCTWPSRARTTS